MVSEVARWLEGLPPVTFFVLAILLVLAPLAARAQAELAYKPYSGVRVSPTSLMQLYDHDQTLVVAELGPGRTLLSCEVIEVKTPEIKKKAKKDLSRVARAIPIAFDEMLNLMLQCQDIEPPPSLKQQRSEGRVNRQTNSLSVFSGILPGTKWCGTGDIATSYHDLGPQDFDKCCRTHDLCPVKVMSSKTRYNLTNTNIYSKSHCECDRLLFECLKKNRNPTAAVVGNLYFNIVRVECLEEVPCSRSDCNSPAFRFRAPMTF